MKLIESNFVRSDNWTDFKNQVNFQDLPSGTRFFKVKIIDGNDGSSSCEYATDDSERDDMTSVSGGYFFECSWITKK